MSQQRVRVRWRTVALACVAVLLMCVWVMLRSEPRVWKEQTAALRALTPEQVQVKAAQLETRITEQLGLAKVQELLAEVKVKTPEAVFAALRAKAAAQQSPVPDELPIREIHMSLTEINAWMQANFHEWAAYKGYTVPPELGTPVIGVEGAELVMAFEFRKGSFAQVFSAGFELDFTRPQGKAAIHMHDVRAGNLPLPDRAIGSALRSGAPDATPAAKVGEWLHKLEGFEFTPMIPLDEHVKARVLGQRLAADGITLTVRLEPRGTSLEPPAAQVIAAVQTE